MTENPLDVEGLRVHILSTCTQMSQSGTAKFFKTTIDSLIEDVDTLNAVVKEKKDFQHVLEKLRQIKREVEDGKIKNISVLRECFTDVVAEITGASLKTKSQSSTNKTNAIHSNLTLINLPVKHDPAFTIEAPLSLELSESAVHRKLVGKIQTYIRAEFDSGIVLIRNGKFLVISDNGLTALDEIDRSKELKSKADILCETINRRNVNSVTTVHNISTTIGDKYVVWIVPSKMERLTKKLSEEAKQYTIYIK